MALNSPLMFQKVRDVMMKSEFEQICRSHYLYSVNDESSLLFCMLMTSSSSVMIQNRQLRIILRSCFNIKDLVQLKCVLGIEVATSKRGIAVSSEICSIHVKGDEYAWLKVC